MSHSARQQWLERWSAELFGRLEPVLREVPGSKVEKMMVKRPLVEVSERLRAPGTLRFLDARRPKLGKADEPVSAGQPEAERSPWPIRWRPPPGGLRC